MGIGKAYKVDPEEAIDTTARRGRQEMSSENENVESRNQMIRAQERAGMGGPAKRLRDTENELARERNKRRD